LGKKVGISAPWVSAIERGEGAGAPLEVWYALSEALAIPLKVEFQRDAISDVADGGHLKLQELALRLGRQTQRRGAFELPTKPADPTYSIDVCLRDDAMRVLFIEECCNTFGNINASVRSTRRKVADAGQMAIAIGGEAGPYRVPAVWIVRDT
jgi:transcriptional regulator with XRE-family HTH domain